MENAMETEFLGLKGALHQHEPRTQNPENYTLVLTQEVQKNDLQFCETPISSLRFGGQLAGEKSLEYIICILYTPTVDGTILWGWEGVQDKGP